MPHNMVIGMTGSGKSTLGKIIVKDARNRGIKTAVLDPLGDKWNADFQTADPKAFLEYVKGHYNLIVIVDESGTSIGKFNEEMEWLATNSRHHYHTCFFLCQRGQQVSPTIRTNCRYVYMFACNGKDRISLSEEYDVPEVAKLPKPEELHFYKISGFEKTDYFRVDWHTMKVYKVERNPNPSPSEVK